MVEIQTKNQNIFWLWSDKVDWSKRGDVFYWLPEFLDREKTVKGGINLQDSLIKNITYGHTPSGGKNTYTDKGILFIRSGQLNDFFLDLTDKVYISENTHRKMQRSVIKGRDVLVATVGATIGAVAITPEIIKEANCNQAVGILRTDEKRLNPYYLAIYLSSPYGKEQILRQSSGGARDNLDPFELKRIRVILPSITSQQKVEQIVKDAFQLKKESEADYQKSQKLLNEALGLTGIEERREMTFWRWSDEVDIVLRIDPNYYQKYFQEMKARRAEVKTTKLEKLSLLIDYGTVPTSPDAPPELGTPYLTGKNIQPNELVLDKLDYLYTNTTHSIRNKAIEAGDVLITQMGTVGNAAVMSEGQGGWFFGSFLIRVRPNKSVSPEWLALVINSDFGKQQIQQAMTTATVRTNTDLPTIKSLEIPVIDKKKETEIVNLYIQSRDKKVLSKQKLQEAKDFVENLVRRA